MVSQELYDRIVKLAGKEPVNPLGTCFDSVGNQLIEIGVTHHVKNYKICHGIGTSNMLGQEGLAIAHAWIEYDLISKNRRIAMDTTWGDLVYADIYRKDLKIEHVVEYTAKEFLRKWVEFNYPGPWDYKIVELQKFNGVHNKEQLALLEKKERH